MQPHAFEASLVPPGHRRKPTTNSRLQQESCTDPRSLSQFDDFCEVRVVWPPGELQCQVVIALAPGGWGAEYDIGDQMSVVMIPVYR